MQRVNKTKPSEQQLRKLEAPAVFAELLFADIIGEKRDGQGKRFLNGKVDNACQFSFKTGPQPERQFICCLGLETH
jgi:hypothetical protein